MKLLPKAEAYLMENPKVIFAYLFGGLTKGKSLPMSDVDIAVFLSGDVDYQDEKMALHEEGILNQDLFEIMEKMAKFRNIIIHRYDKADEAIVVGILKRHLDDFLLFKKAIIDFLKKD
jgi:predicted nucleotidyltransferase